MIYKNAILCKSYQHVIYYSYFMQRCRLSTIIWKFICIYFQNLIVKNGTYTELSPLRLPSPSEDTLLACFTRWRHSKGATSSLRWTLIVEDFFLLKPIRFLWPEIEKDKSHLYQIYFLVLKLNANYYFVGEKKCNLCNISDLNISHARTKRTSVNEVSCEKNKQIFHIIHSRFVNTSIRKHVICR